MTLDELKQRIEKFSGQIDSFNPESINGKTLVSTKNELSEYAKAVVFPDDEERNAVLGSIETFGEGLKKKLKEQEEFFISFSISIDQEIDNYEKLIDSTPLEGNFNKEIVAPIKELADRLFEEFKKEYWPTKEAKTVAKARFQALREKFKKNEDLAYEKIRLEKQAFFDKSAALSQQTIGFLENCRPSLAMESTLEGIKIFLAYLQNEGFGNDVTTWLVLSHNEDLNKTLKIRSELIKGTRKFATDQKDSFGKEDRNRVFTKADEVSQDLSKAWDEQKEEAKRKQLEWTERKKEQDAKRAEWETKQLAFVEILEKKVERKNNEKQGLEKILGSKKEYSKRTEKRIKDHEDYLYRLNKDHDELMEQLKTAWSTSFKDKTLERIELKKQKIEEVEKDIADLTKKHGTVGTEIASFEKRLGTLDNDLKETTDKIQEVRKNIGHKATTKVSTPDVPEPVATTTKENPVPDNIKAESEEAATPAENKNGAAPEETAPSNEGLPA